MHDLENENPQHKLGIYAQIGDTMYAVIKTGGKQYRVSKEQILKIEKLDKEVGESVDFEEILMIADAGNTQVGSPFVSGAKVKAEVIGHGRGDKIEILKFKRRKHHLKRQGHRQDYTKVKITEID